MGKNSYCNYGSMQRDAERRVYEMQRRTQQIFSGEIDSLHGSGGCDRRSIPYRGEAAQVRDEPRVHSDRERLSDTELLNMRGSHYDVCAQGQHKKCEYCERPREAECCDKPCEGEKGESAPPVCEEKRCEGECANEANPLLSFLGKFSDDPERILLLVILLLLGDGADTKLILVLLYLIM